MLVSWVPPEQTMSLKSAREFAVFFSVDNFRKRYGENARLHGTHLLCNLKAVEAGFSKIAIAWTRSYPTKSVRAVSMALPEKLPALTKMTISTIIMVTQIAGMDIRTNEAHEEMISRIKI